MCKAKTLKKKKKVPWRDKCLLTLEFHEDGDKMHLQHYVTKAELIWTGDVSHMTFTSASRMCSCNCICAACKCQIVYLDPVRFSAISQWHTFLSWKRNVLSIKKKKKNHTFYSLWTCLSFLLLRSLMNCSASLMYRRTSRVSEWKIWLPATPSWL